MFSGWAVDGCDIMLGLPCVFPVTWPQCANFLTVFSTIFTFPARTKHCKIRMEAYSLFCICLTEADMAKKISVIEKPNLSWCIVIKMIFMHVQLISVTVFQITRVPGNL